MTRCILSIICCFALLYATPGIAQPVPGLEKVTGELKRLQLLYNTTPLSFEVKYAYSNEHTPEEVLDSVQGKIEIDGSNYRCLLDNTETIRNDRYSIVLFREDKVMYLTKGASASSAADPLQMMKSMLERSGAISCTVDYKGSSKTMTIRFKEGGPCKQMQITVDTVAQQLLAMQYVVKTSQLTEMPETADTTAQGYEEYALVRAGFYNYRRITPDSTRFDEHSFFYKEGDEFKATAAYSDYKLFIATPNL